MTVPSLDPLSEMIRGRYGWHELGCPLDSKTYYAAKAWNPTDVCSNLAASYEGSMERRQRDSRGGPLPDRRRPRMLVRSALFDERVGYWEHAAFVAEVRKGRDAAAAASSSVLLRVKAGGHDCFDTAEDDAELCAFLEASVC